MSPLQIGLLVIAVVAVAAVYLYNLFEERRVQRRMDGAFQKPEDVLLSSRAAAAATTRREPSLAATPSEEDAHVRVSLSEAARPLDATPATAVVETIDIAPLPEEAEAAAALSPESERNGQLGGPDALIECLAYFSFTQPRDARVLRAAFAPEVGGNVTWYGRGGTEDAWWILGPEATSLCREIAAGLLLANRQGAVSRSVLRGFLDAMNEIARRTEATLMLPDALAESARADALDKACAAVDVQIGLSLLRRDGAALAGTRLRGVVEGAGFRLNGRGGFDYVHEDSDKLMFELLDLGGRPLRADGLKTLQVAGVTLLLDVPRICEPVKAFDQMRTVARRLAHTLEATLVDDARRPLTDTALATIRTQLQQTCAAMRDMDVEPGGARSLRLFS